MYLVYLLVGTLLLTGISFVRYTTTGSDGDSANVAADGVTVAHASNTMIEMFHLTSDSLEASEFQFSVSSQNSEVAIQYGVIVTLNEALSNGVSMMLDNTPYPAGDETTFTFENASVFSAGNSNSQHIRRPLSAIMRLLAMNPQGRSPFPSVQNRLIKVGKAIKLPNIAVICLSVVPSRRSIDYALCRNKQ